MAHGVRGGSSGWSASAAVAAAAVTAALSATPPAEAKITIKGDAAEKATIQKAIDDMKATSPTAKALFNELAARPEESVIRFGKTSDLATASADGTVVLNKLAIECLKQVDKPGGGGRALEATSLGHIIVHEALGHVLNGFKRRDNREPTATAVENKVRAEQGLPRQTKLNETVGDKQLIPFSDGSKVDVTDALRKANANFQLPMDATLALHGTLTADGLVDLTLDPTAGTQHVALDLAETGGGLELVQVLGLTATLAPTDAEDFTLEAIEFAVTLDSFLYGGEATGLNFFGLIEPNRGLVGQWDFAGGGSDIAFELSGDFAWSNPLFDAHGQTGYAMLELRDGELEAIDDATWSGAATAEGAAYPPIIPEPATAALLSLGVLALIRRRPLA